MAQRDLATANQAQANATLRRLKEVQTDTTVTSPVNGYVVEGHVPAEAIKRLLRERPAVAGIAVPGMPMGSPGMDGPMRESYEVRTFGGKVGQSVFAKY